MYKHNQKGGVATIALLFLLLIMLLAAVGFGAWAYSGRQSYKNDVDAKIAVAVTAAKKQQTAADNAQFAIEEQSPYKTYNGPQAYGSLVLNFPRDWSAYIDDTGSGQPINGYFAANVVPSLSAQGSVFALRLEVVNRPYNSVTQSFVGPTRSGKMTVQAYALPKVPSVVGIKATGTIGGLGTSTASGPVTLVVLPVRSDTLEIWTTGSQNLSTFNDAILPNVSFSP